MERCDQEAINSLPQVLLGDTKESQFLEKEVQQELLFSGHVYRAIKHTVELVDGTLQPRELVHHFGGAVIAAETETGDFLLVRQYRFAAQAELLEFPAGKLEFGEVALTCAKRELEEECGYQAGTIIDLGFIYPTPGYSTEKIYLFYAKDLHKTAQHLDEGEFLSGVSFKLEEILALIQAGKIHDAKTIALAYKVQQYKQCQCKD